MSSNSVMIRVPAHLHAALVAYQQNLQRQELEGKIIGRSRNHDDGMPLWEVIERLLQHKQQHRQRGRVYTTRRRLRTTPKATERLNVVSAANERQ